MTFPFKPTGLLAALCSFEKLDGVVCRLFARVPLGLVYTPSGARPVRVSSDVCARGIAGTLGDGMRMTSSGLCEKLSTASTANEALAKVRSYARVAVEKRF